MRLHNIFADPQRPVPHDARILRPADWQQIRDLPNDTSAVYRAVT
jgi:hypothetical protein